jgi:hypothetical protein
MAGNEYSELNGMIGAPKTQSGKYVVGRRTMPTPSTFVISLTVLLGGCGAPSDASIIERFNAHRAEFQQLVEMFRTDGIEGRIRCDGRSPEGDDAVRVQQPISAQRRAEYEKIFRVYGCDTAAYYYSGRGIATFPLWSRGMLWAGADKSIVFIPDQPPAPLLASTDNYHWTQRDHAQGAVTLYRNIDGPWYVEYDEN